MKLIRPSVQYLAQEKGLNGVYRQIERAGRTCYKSEDKITDTSAEAFVERLKKNGHTAMLEHGTVYLERKNKNNSSSFFFQDRYYRNPYSRVIICNNCTYIATNYRVIVENGWEDDLQYIVEEPTRYHFDKRYTLKFVTDRATANEMVRHRAFSFAQESTRFCDYHTDKFGGELAFIVPSWANIDTKKYEDFTPEEKILYDTLAIDEREYLFATTHLKLKAEDARQILPLALKTELVMTGYEKDWQHFLNLRLRGTTGRPHPEMLKIAEMASAILSEKIE